jgi:hypothetical protein
VLRLIRIFFLAVVVLTAPANAALSGFVFDSDGRPLGNATVTAFAAEPTAAKIARYRSAARRSPLLSGATPMSTSTDAQGRFELPLTGTSLVELEIDAEGFAPAMVRSWSDAGIVTVALKTAAPVAGKVMAARKPVSGAVVVWVGRDGRQKAVVTSADGSYSIPDPKRWGERVMVFHPDFAPLLDYWGERLTVAHSLQRGAAVSGSVVSTSGKPQPEAEILVNGVSYGQSDSEGKFVLQHVRDDYRTIEARAEGAAILVKRGGTTTLQLAPARKVSGTVRSAAGRPLAGVVVLAHNATDESVAVETLSDDKGRYSFTNLPAGRYGITADPPHYAYINASERPEVDPFTVDLRQKQAATLDLVLQPFVRVAGRVVDAESSPVGGASIVAAPAGAPLFQSLFNGQGEAVSAPDGRFTLLLSPQWTDELQLIVRHGSHAPGRSERFAPKGKAPAEVTIRLGRGVEVSGQIVDASGRGVEEATIAWIEVDDKSGFRPPAEQLLRNDGGVWPKSGKGGSFVVRVGEGKYDFAATAPGHRAGSERGVEVGSAGAKVRLVLEPAATISGIVVREDGTPVEGVRIAVVDDRRTVDEAVTTAADGSFTLGGVAPGELRLMAMKPEEMVEETITTTAPASNLRIVVPAAGGLRGKVINAGTRLPVGQFTVVLKRKSAVSGRRPEQYTQKRFYDANGLFDFPALPAGEIELSVTSEGYVPAKTKKITLVAGEKSELEIVLDTGASISGRVSDESGRAVADASVSVEFRGEGGETFDRFGPPMTASDESGDFALTGIAPGVVSLAVRREGFVVWRKEIEAEGKRRVDVTLSRGVTLRGVVTSNGRPVEGADVMVHSTAFNVEGQGARTDAAGEFSVTGLVAGLYTVAAYKESLGQAQLEDVDVARAGRVAIDIPPAATGVITGSVSGLPAGFTERYSVRMVTASSDSNQVQSGIERDGTFRIESAPVGRVRVIAYLQSDGETRTSDQQIVEVGTGGEASVSLTFGDQLTVSGRVTRGGAPVRGGNVIFMQEGIEGGATVTTSDDGRFEAALTRAGTYRVMVHSRDLSVPYHSYHTISGSTVLDLEIAEIVVSGVVVNGADGTPIRGARVAALIPSSPALNYRAESVSDDEGRFRFVVATAGTYRLLAEREGFGQHVEEVRLESGTSEHRIELVPSNGAVVVVVDARDGRVLQPNLIVTDGSGQPVLNGYRQPRSDGSVLLPLSPGSYRVTALVWQYAPQWVNVSSPSSAKVTIPMSRGGTVVIVLPQAVSGSVTLVGSNGVMHVKCCDGVAVIPIEGVRTMVEHVAAGGYTAVLTGSDGREIARKGFQVGERSTSEVFFGP